MTISDILKENDKPFIAVAFDGVFIPGKEPYDPRVINEDPIPQSLKWLQHMMTRYRVIIFSQRNKSWPGVHAMQMWLKKNKFPIQAIKKLYFNAEKPEAIVFIDPRGMQFCGIFPTIEEIEQFKPWNAE